MQLPFVVKVYQASGLRPKLHVRHKPFRVDSIEHCYQTESTKASRNVVVSLLSTKARTMVTSGPYPNLENKKDVVGVTKNSPS